MPIQNRVDMLATGVNTTDRHPGAGPRSRRRGPRRPNEIAAVVKRVRGAVDVVADPIRGKRYLEIRFDRERAARLGVSVGEVNEVIETALAGKAVTRRSRAASGTRWSSATRATSARTRNRSATCSSRRERASAGRHRPRFARSRSAEVADVQVVEGPATIKGENGLLRNYVRLNVRERDAVDFVARGSPGRRPRGQAARRRLRRVDRPVRARAPRPANARWSSCRSSSC